MKKVAGVVVTYNRPDLLKKCLESVLAQSLSPDRIIIIDNSPKDDTREMVEKYFPSVVYRHFPDNIGSEGGYYEGIKLACEDNDYVWLLDDDCISEREALAELVKWAEELKKEHKVGAVRSARPWDKGEGLSILEIEDLFAWRGTMILSETVKGTGLPEKDLFLYGGDIEYGLRMGDAGYHMYLVYPSKISSMGYSEKLKKDFGMVRAESYAQPFRIYYSYRNELWIYAKYKRTVKLLKLLLHGAKNFCFHIFSRRKKEAIAILDGIKDGFGGKLGKSDKYLP
ncbi:MAG: glycosyltransferase [Candidatus Omnitrophota bacterium]